MFKINIFLILFLITASHLSAQITVEITPIGLTDGLAQIENMVNSETGDTAEAVEDMIDIYAEKPLLFEAMSDALTTTAEIFPSLKQFSDNYSIYTGTSAAITSAETDISELGSTLETFTIEEDFYFGAALQGFSAGFTFPADFLLNNLYVSTGFGYSSFYYDEINISSANIRLGASYRFPGRELNKLIRWNGIGISSGAAWSSNSINTSYPAEDIIQTFSLDPDGAGPVVPFDITIQVSPVIDITYRNNQFTFPLAVSTDLDFFKLIDIAATAGLALTFGSNSIGVSVDDEIEVQGYLADLVDTAPRIVVSGEQTGSRARIITPFAGGSISVRLGRLLLNVPVCWDFKNTLTAGISLGAEF